MFYDVIPIWSLPPPPFWLLMDVIFFPSWCKRSTCALCCKGTWFNSH